MGYRCDIDLEMNRDAFEKLKELAEKDPMVREYLSYADVQEPGQKSHNALLRWNDIKWIGYENDPKFFPHVDKMQKFLESLPQDSYFFDATGEDGETYHQGLLFEKDSSIINPVLYHASELVKEYGADKVAQWLEESALKIKEEQAQKQSGPSM